MTKGLLTLLLARSELVGLASTRKLRSRRTQKRTL
jgi:hypothetical protein